MNTEDRVRLEHEFIKSLMCSGSDIRTFADTVKAVVMFIDSGEDISRSGWKQYKAKHGSDESVLNRNMYNGVLSFLSYCGCGYRREKRSVKPAERKDVYTKRNHEVVSRFAVWMNETLDLSENTVRSYVYAASDYFSYMDEFTNDKAKRYVEALKKNGMSGKTINLRISGIIMLARFMKKRIEIKRVKVPKRLSVENVLTEKEYEKMISFAKDYPKKEYYFWLRILATTGVRVSEFCGINWEDVVKGKAVIKGKGNKERIVFFPKSLQSEAERYVKDNRKSGLVAGVTTRGVSCAIRNLSIKSGVPPEKTHPHAFRHFFAKMFLKKKNDVVQLSEILGHESVDITRIYLQKSYEEQQKDFNRTVTW